MNSKENKILLAKAIGESLYSGIICTDSGHGDSIITDFEWDAKTCEGIVYCFDFDEYVRIDNVKLYLRPMSSMTEEEREEWHDTFESVYDLVPGGDPDNEDDYDDNWHEQPGVESYDYLIAHHFDYRGLIPMGLALPATKNMYNDKN